MKVLSTCELNINLDILNRISITEILLKVALNTIAPPNADMKPGEQLLLRTLLFES